MKKILIIEDDINIVNLLKVRFDLTGYKTYSGTSAYKGMNIARAYKIDLIILDLIMPEMDGFEVCAHLRNDPKTVDIPILILSGTTRIMDIDRAIEMGANDYVFKPFKWVNLHKKIIELLEIS